MNVVATITSDVSSHLAGLPVALMLANTFIVNDRYHIDSLSSYGLSHFIRDCNNGVNLPQRGLGY